MASDCSPTAMQAATLLDVPKKNPAAVALGRRGGKARAASLSEQERTDVAKTGAAARSASLTKKRRSEIAKKAAKARWSK